MKALDSCNPLVALAKNNEPRLTDGQALVAALEIRDRYAAGIKEISTLAEGALGLLGDGTDPTSVRNAVTGFVGGLAAGGVRCHVNIFIAAYPHLYDRVLAVTGPSSLDADAVHKLLADCVAMKTGGSAAE